MQNRRIIFGATLLALAFLPGAQAVSPPPDGCYPNFTTAEGCNALNFLTTGAGNTGVGSFALYMGGDGGSNTAVGAAALALNTADSNTAVGATALLLNTTGSTNTAVGRNALTRNVTAEDNNAVGAFALFNNDSTGTGLANFNNAYGRNALLNNVDGDENEQATQIQKVSVQLQMTQRAAKVVEAKLQKRSFPLATFPKGSRRECPRDPTYGLAID